MRKIFRFLCILYSFVVIFACKMIIRSDKMIKRVFCAFVIFCALTIVTAIAVFASPSIIQVRHNWPTGVVQGVSVTFTVYVSAETNFVWARSGVDVVPGVREDRAGAPHGTPAGTRVFNVTVWPNETGNVYILANSTNDITTAVSRAEHIIVTDGLAGQPGLVGGIQILGVTETRAIAPNTVQLTVITGVQARYVWVRFDAYPHNWRLGELQSESPTGRIWTINYAPSPFVPHQVQVGSNTEYNVIGASLQDVTVTLSAPYLPRLNPQIYGRTLSPDNVNVGNIITVRVNTNADTYSVWVADADGIVTVGRRIPPFVPETVRHFEVMVAPYRTGALTIFAGTGVGDPHAVYIVENVVVHVPHVYITQASVTQVANSLHQEATIWVTTNQNAGSVWVVLPDGETIRLGLAGQPTAQGDRLWEARPAGVPSPNVTIRVSPTSSDIPSVTQTISNWGTAQGGQLLPITGVTGFTPNSARRGTSPRIQFYVPDNITHVIISGTDGIATINALPEAHPSGGRQRWAATPSMPTGANISHVTLTVTTYINAVRSDIAHHVVTLTN